MNDVVVIGGGIVGSSVAYRLARNGVRTTLVDRMDQGQATAAGAGIVSPGVGHQRSAAYHALTAKAVSYYQQLLVELAEDGETETGYDTVGSLFIAMDDDEAQQLGDVRQFAESRRAAGVPGVGEVSWLDGDAARSLFPALGSIEAAVHISGSARVNGRLMRDSLQRAAQKRGVTLIRSTARLVRDHGNRMVVEVDGKRLTAEAIVIAGGAWSRSFGDGIGIDMPVVPQRGQIVHLQLLEHETSRWPIISTFHDQYILTFPSHRVVAGATREDGSCYDYRLTAGGVKDVLNHALWVAPGLAPATLEEVRIGFRPATPDQLPILGQVPGVSDVYIATGHGPSGLTLGPYSGAVVADLVRGETVDLDLAPYSPDRFQHPAQV